MNFLLLSVVVFCLFVCLFFNFFLCVLFGGSLPFLFYPQGVLFYVGGSFHLFCWAFISIYFLQLTLTVESVKIILESEATSTTPSFPVLALNCSAVVQIFEWTGEVSYYNISTSHFPPPPPPPPPPSLSLSVCCPYRYWYKFFISYWGVVCSPV